MSQSIPPDWPVGDSFYTSPDWLRFVDSDGLGVPFYAELNGTGLVAHHAPDERHPDYRLPSVLGLDEQHTRLLLGGRRGFCSPVVATANSTPALTPLIDAALTANPEAAGSWWWPYLPSADLPHVLAAARALTGADPGVHLVGADCVVDLPPAGEQFESCLPTAHRRTNWRREWRRFADSGLELRRLPLADAVERGAVLLQQVESKYGNTYSEQYLSSFLGRQARFLADAAVVHAIFDGPRMTGFSLCYTWRNELAARLLGLDYGALRDAAEYAVLMMHAPARFAMANGIGRLHLGMEAFAAKCRRGARVRALWAVVPGTVTSDRAILDRADSILTKMPATEGAAFRAEIEEIRKLSAAVGGGAA